MENRDWRKRLRELYSFENDDATSPNSIDFNWGSFIFKRKVKEPAPFYLARVEWIEDFIQAEIDKARKEVVEDLLSNEKPAKVYDGEMLVVGKGYFMKYLSEKEEK